MTAKRYETITASVDDRGVANLVLSRPEAGNAVNLTMARELSTLTAAWVVDPSIRVVCVTGAGDRFCVGGDLKSFHDVDDLAVHLTEVASLLHLAIARLARMDAPIIASVNGTAAGAGMSLVAMADLAIASATATFVLAYSAIGLTPDGSATWSLPRVVGLRAAQELALTNRVLTATEAADVGLVTRTVGPWALEAETEALALRISAGPTRALGRTKRLLRAGGREGLETQLEAETGALAAGAADAEAREGISAFLEKRPPDFRGASM